MSPASHGPYRARAHQISAALLPVQTTKRWINHSSAVPEGDFDGVRESHVADTLRTIRYQTCSSAPLFPDLALISGLRRTIICRFAKLARVLSSHPPARPPRGTSSKKRGGHHIDQHEHTSSLSYAGPATKDVPLMRASEVRKTVATPRYVLRRSSFAARR